MLVSISKYIAPPHFAYKMFSNCPNMTGKALYKDPR